MRCPKWCEIIGESGESVHVRCDKQRHHSLDHEAWVDCANDSSARVSWSRPTIEEQEA